MADNLLENIGDLPQVVNQKESDLFEIEGTDGSGSPTSNKESRSQLKSNMAGSGAVPDMVETRIAASVGARDFEANHAYKQNQLIFSGGGLYRAKYAFTSAASLNPIDWEKVAVEKWGEIAGALSDQDDLQDALDAKLDREIDYSNGVESRFAHESDGGGYWVENANDNSVSFVGGNADTSSGIKVETYAKNRSTNIGTRFIQTLAKIFYTKGKTSAVTTADDEIAVQSDVAGALADAKSYADGKIAQLPKGAYYQGKLDYYGATEAALAEFTPAEGQRALVADVDKIGTYTSGAWALADIAGLQEGYYWLVVDLGESERHYQGRVIYNASGGWDINEDRQNMPDGVTLDYDSATGATKVADINETNVAADDTDFDDTVSGGFLDVLLSVFEKIRGLFSLMAGKVNIQQNASDEGKAMVIGSDGKLGPGVSGKVDSIDGVGPEADTKNVKLSWVYDTEADYEADKGNIPEGARVVKLYEYPENTIYSADRPDLWPDLQEVDLGGGLYGIAFGGVFPDWSGGPLNKNTLYSISGWNPATGRIIKSGGGFQKGIDATWHALGYHQWASAAYCNAGVVISSSSYVWINAAFGGCTYNVNNANYWIWIIYRK